MLSELLAANLCTPFILKQVEGGSANICIPGNSLLTYPARKVSSLVPAEKRTVRQKPRSVFGQAILSPSSSSHNFSPLSFGVA